MASLQELELDEISEWPLLPQLLVILLIMLLIQGAGYWFYLMPKQDEIALLKQEEETVKATLRIKANKVAVLPQIQAQLDELKERYDFLLRQLPVQKELASSLGSLVRVPVRGLIGGSVKAKSFFTAYRSISN